MTRRSRGQPARDASVASDAGSATERSMDTSKGRTDARAVSLWMYPGFERARLQPRRRSPFYSCHSEGLSAPRNLGFVPPTRVFGALGNAPQRLKPSSYPPCTARLEGVPLQRTRYRRVSSALGLTTAGEKPPFSSNSGVPLAVAGSTQTSVLALEPCSLSDRAYRM